MVTYHKQETTFSCGASAIKNGLIALGHNRISEKTIRKLANTTKKGTDGKGILNTFNLLGYECSELNTKSGKYFKRVLLKTLKEGGICIVLIDSINHWIAVIEYFRRKIVFIDSDFKKIKQRFNVRYFIPMCRNYDKFTKQEYYYLIKVNKNEKDN